MLAERLLVPARVPSRRIHLMPVTAKDLRRACSAYARAIESAAPLDVVHLGIGDDGHTASWPPGDPVIDSERDVDVSAEYQGVRRMTMTPHVVNAGRMRLMLVTEPSKAPVVRRWIDGDKALPVSRLRRTSSVIVAITGVLS
jgi:6-phosphogluconolactonase/glucosamine-6-phosphate isomerase/deaminase